jgi:hypothetical protein
MTICIAGMHRSGSSMVTRLLNLCGLDLGPEEDLSAAAFDNEAGFWENCHFVRLNEDALARFGGGWDLPPALPEGWESSGEMAELRGAAAELVGRFGPGKAWGWKDPRNSILLPFWKSLIPDLKVLVCLRDPLEVAQSLRHRGYSSLAFGLSLWLTYSQRMLSSTRPGERVVTHYDAYFCDPQAELQRVLGLLELAASPETIEQACATVSAQLRHNWVKNEEPVERAIPLDVQDVYRSMCGEAGEIYRAAADRERDGHAPGSGSVSAAIVT